MDEPTAVGHDAADPGAPTPRERLSTAADEITHDAQALADKAAHSAESAYERLSEGADEARERVGQSAENLVDELRGIGSRLAAALQAAASTPEAETLKSDIREGSQRLVAEVQAAIKASPIGKIGGRPDASNGDADSDAPTFEGQTAMPSAPTGQRMATTVRSELANALRGLNRVLDRLAGQIERPPAEVDASDQTSPRVPSDDAPPS